MIDIPHKTCPSLPHTTNTSSLDLLSQLELKPFSALKTAFIQWIRSLPMEERFLVLKIYSPPVPQAIRKLLTQLQSNSKERSFQVGSSFKDMFDWAEMSTEHRKSLSKIEKAFSDSLVFVSDGGNYMDHICFQYGQLDCPDKLFQLLMCNLDPLPSYPMLEALKSRKLPATVSEDLQKCQNRQELAHVIIDFLRSEVFTRFKESIIDPEFISRNLQEEKKRKKQFSMHWKCLSEQMRKQLLLMGHTSLEALVKWLALKEISLTEQELSREIEQLLKLDKNQFCNRILKCKFKRCLSPLVNYYELVYNYWRGEVQHIRKNRGKQLHSDREGHRFHRTQKYHRNRRFSHRKSNSMQSNETNVTITEQQKIKFKRQVCFNINSPQDESERSKETNPEVPQEKKSIETNHTKLERKPEKKRNKKEGQCDKSHKKFERHTKEGISSIESAVKQRKASKSYRSVSNFSVKQQYVNGQKEKLEEYQPDWSNVIISKLSEQLQQMSDRLSEQANEFHERRIIAYERIQFLLSYYNIPIKLFGSCASGIAIKNSDIDIAVDNSILSMFDYLPENIKLQAALENMEQLFQSQPCFTHIKLIKTAAIPLIKLTIDTSVPFLDVNYGSVYYTLNRKHFSGPIEADITIQTVNKLAECTHLGLISTEAINKWLADISCLHEIVIVMKQLFKVKGFNVTYEGGLNTFSMIVLLVSYIYHAKLEKETNTAQVLKEILRYYAYEFNEKQIGIDLAQYGKGEIFYVKKEKENNKFLKLSKEKAELEVLDPICEGKNMTRNCYLFAEMKVLFKNIYDKCYCQSIKEVQTMKKQFKNGRKYGDIQEKYKEKYAKRNVFVQFFEQL